MKKTVLIISLVLCWGMLQAQRVNGTWVGNLDLNGNVIEVIFHVTETANGFVTTMDYPAQNAFGISTTSTAFENAIITILLDDESTHYQGRLMKDNTIRGIFTQMGSEHYLQLKYTPFSRSNKLQSRK